MHWRRNLPSALETVVLCHDKRHARKLRAASRRSVLFLADTGYCTPESHVSGERTGNDRRWVKFRPAEIPACSFLPVR